MSKYNEVWFDGAKPALSLHERPFTKVVETRIRVPSAEEIRGLLSSRFGEHVADAEMPLCKSLVKQSTFFMLGIYDISWGRSSEGCLEFIAGKGSIMPRYLGLLLAQPYLSKHIGHNSVRSLIGFDRKENLINRATGYVGVPAMQVRPNGDVVYKLASFEGVWPDNHALVTLVPLLKSRKKKPHS